MRDFPGMKAKLILGCIFALLVGCSKVVEKPIAHATVADPDHYKLELENDYVKVIRVGYGPKEKSPIHSHSKLVAVHLTDAKGKFTLRNGESTVIEAKAGGIGEDPEVEHTVENLLDQQWDTILVEFKKKYPRSISELNKDATKVAPKHYIVEMENDWVRVCRIKYGPNEESVMHEHNPGVVVHLNAIKGRLTNEDGTVVDFEREAGSVLWADAITHSGLNLKDGPIEGVFFELK